MSETQAPELLPAISTAVAEYSETAAALAQLRSQLEGHVFDCTTTAGDREARQSRMALVKLRVALEDKRKEIKAPLLERSRLIDDEAKRITREIVEMELPIDQVIRAEEARKQAIKDEADRQARIRQEAIDAELAEIRHAPLALIDADPEAIEAALAAMKERTPLQAFDDVDESTSRMATALQQEAVDRLESMLVRAREAAEAAEALARERAENERVRKEAAQKEQTRIEAERQAARIQAAATQRAGIVEANIRKLREAPLELVGAPSTMLEAAIAALGGDLDPRKYDDRLADATAARDEAVARMTEMLDAARTNEAAAAELREKRAREEAEQAERERLAEEQRARETNERIERERKERAEAERLEAERLALELENTTLREAATDAADLIESEWGEDCLTAKKLRAALAREEAPKPARKRRAKA